MIHLHSELGKLKNLIPTKNVKDINTKVIEIKLHCDTLINEHGKHSDVGKELERIVWALRNIHLLLTKNTIVFDKLLKIVEAVENKHIKRITELLDIESKEIKT